MTETDIFIRATGDSKDSLEAYENLAECKLVVEDEIVRLMNKLNRRPRANTVMKIQEKRKILHQIEDTMEALKSDISEEDRQYV